MPLEIARPVQFRPNRVYRLRRALKTDAHHLPAIERLVRLHDRNQLLRRVRARLACHLASGELILLFVEESRRLELIGVAIGDTDDATETLEICHTVIADAYRGLRLAELVSGAAIVGQCIAYDQFSAVFLTVHPENDYCLSACSKLGCEVATASELIGSIPALDDVINDRRLTYLNKGWETEPMVGIVPPNTIQEAAQRMLAASQPSGLPYFGARVYLDGDWCNGYPPDGEGITAHLRSLAAGALPNVLLWDAWRFQVRRVRMVA